jgi:hypothetical protein
MKMLVCALALFCGTNAFAQDKEATAFVLDHSKPFAYLQFDHIGTRKPLQSGEGTTGLWLRIVNNCHIPIVFRGHNAAEGDPGFNLDNEILPEDSTLQIFATQEEGAEIERKQRERELELRHKPRGYESEVSGVIRVDPGKEILFSVPLSHVGEYWFMRVKFALDIERSSISVGPFTFLDFHKWEIPKNDELDGFVLLRPILDELGWKYR